MRDPNNASFDTRGARFYYRRVTTFPLVDGLLIGTERGTYSVRLELGRNRRIGTETGKTFRLVDRGGRIGTEPVRNRYGTGSVRPRRIGTQLPCIGERTCSVAVTVLARFCSRRVGIETGLESGASRTKKLDKGNAWIHVAEGGKEDAQRYPRADPENLQLVFRSQHESTSTTPQNSLSAIKISEVN